MVGELDSDNAHVYWLLMLMVLHFPLTIWSSLVFAGLGVSVWSLLLLSLSCFRSPGRPVALAIADLLFRLLTVGSSEEPSSCCPVRSCSLGVGHRLWFLFLCVQLNFREVFSLLCQLLCMLWIPWEIFSLWGWLLSCLVCRGTTVMPSSCSVFWGVE
jgi:hypothetical protein